jgi:PBP1b-binding outer membrane lipoprotein LpoB
MKKVIMILSIGLIGLTSCGTGTTECEGNCNDSTKVDTVKVDTTFVPTNTTTVTDTTM